MIINTVIFSGFLVANLIIGLFYSRGTKNLKEYALGGRNFSTATLTAGIIASWMAGSNLQITAYETYNQGLYYVIPGIADGLSFFIVAYFYAPRMREFLGKLSVAEAMGDLYGKHVRLITSISAIIIGIGNVAIQFTVFTTLLNYFFGITGIYASLISVLIVIAYSTFGGIKAVTFTDMIQFFTFGIILPMSVYIVWKSIHDKEAIGRVFASNPNFDYKQIFNIHNPNFVDTLFLFLFFLIPGLDPVIFQRISMAKNTAQITRSFTVAGIAMITIEYGIIAFLGVLLLSINAPNLTSDNLINYLLDNYFNNEFKGFFIIGIMAMLMSTADSYINTASVLFTNDFCKAIGIKFSERSELLVVRIASIMVGVVALIVSLCSENLLDLIISTYSFYMPVVSVPLILAIFGFRSSSKAALIGMFAGFIAVVIIKLNFEISSLIPGMIANILFFMGTHYIFSQPGGWIGIKDTTILDRLNFEHNKKIKQFFYSLKTFNFIRYSTNNFPSDEKSVVYFGLFSLISIFSNAYSLMDNQLSPRFFEFLYYCGAFFAMIFITYPLWLEKFKNRKIIAMIWQGAIFFNLAFINTLFVLVSKFNSIQTTILMANLITISILLRWQMAITMIISGVLAGAIFFKSYLGLEYLPENINRLQFKIIYVLLLVSSILIAFLKPKQEEHERAEELNQDLSSKIRDQNNELYRLSELKNEFIRNIQHETNTPLMGIVSIGNTLQEHYDDFSDDMRKESIRIIAASSERLTSFVHNLVDLSKLNTLLYPLEIKKIDLSQLVSDILEKCIKLYVSIENKEDQDFIVNIESNIIFNGDEYYIERAIKNIIVNAIQYCKKGKIELSLYKTHDNKIKFAVKDEGIGIPREELSSIFGSFTTSSNTRTKSGGRGIGLAVASAVIKLHKGEITASSDGKSGSIFIVSLANEK